MPIIKKAVRVESNKNAILFSVLFLSGDDSRMSDSSLHNADEEDGLDFGSTFIISNFGMSFKPDQDE